MCVACVDGLTAYKLTIPAYDRVNRELILDCKILCPCQTKRYPRQIPSFPNYFADQRGGIYTLRDKVATPMKVAQVCNPEVRLYAPDGKRMVVPVARVVLEAFGCFSFEGETIWFIDHNCRNVVLSNLQWTHRSFS
jgi:hypothetical protein